MEEPRLSRYNYRMISSPLHVTLLIVLALALAGCRNVSAPSADQQVMNPVTHVVVCWLKNPGDEKARQSVIDSSQRLRSIPGVLDLQVGPVVPSDRPVVDSSFDLALVITFANERALRAYDQHPIHQQLIRQTLQPLVARFIVYDFRNR